jgi:putative transcriptional regulator
MAHFHPPAALIARYATGNLGEAASLLIATHLSLCENCCASAKNFESMGGEMLSCCGAEKVSPACRDKVMAALDAESTPVVPANKDSFVCRVLPNPLRQHVGCGATEIKWHQRWKGVEIHDLKSLPRTQLLRVAAGIGAPPHLHLRPEMTLVLSGTLAEGQREYGRGDVIYHRAGTLHKPRAGYEQDCVCLIVQGL